MDPPSTPPIEVPPIVLPEMACGIEFDPVVDLGAAPFLAEGDSAPGVVDPTPYPDDLRVFANELPNSICSNPGVRLRVSRDPLLPLEFVDVPPLSLRAAEVGLTARDTRRDGGCRIGRAALSQEPVPACVSDGIVTFSYAETLVPNMPDDPWGGTLQGLDVVTVVRLTVVATPSVQLLASF